MSSLFWSKNKREEVTALRAELNSADDSVKKILRMYFEDGCFGGRYKKLEIIQSNLDKLEVEFKSKHERLKKLSKKDDNINSVKYITKVKSDFSNFAMMVTKLSTSCMIDNTKYGSVNQNFWSMLCSLDKNLAYSATSEVGHKLLDEKYDELLSYDPLGMLICVWHAALEKPFSAKIFQLSTQIFNRMLESPHIDTTLAELYAINQVGGEDALSKRIDIILKEADDRYNPKSHETIEEELSIISSALMWMKAYQQETRVLQYMLNSGMEMSSKMQARLQSLSNGGEKTPYGLDISSNGNELYFDISSLTWKGEEFANFFDNLAFQEKKLSYALTIRDENKELRLMANANIPSEEAVLSKLRSTFAIEYGNSVSAEIRECVALSGNGEEIMSGILIKPLDCHQLSLLMHLIQIGKKLNIKFYTLFVPTEANLSSQKQQAISIFNKLSPSVTMWESSLKDASLMAVQQLLNSDFTSRKESEKIDIDNSPVF